MLQLYKLIEVCFMNYSPSGKNQMMDIHEMSSTNDYQYSLHSIGASDQKAVSRASCLSKDIKNTILKKITEKIESETSKASADGKTTCGIKLSVINEFKTKESQPWVDRTHLPDGEVAAHDGDENVSDEEGGDYNDEAAGE